MVEPDLIRPLGHIPLPAVHGARHVQVFFQGVIIALKLPDIDPALGQAVHPRTEIPDGGQIHGKIPHADPPFHDLIDQDRVCRDLLQHISKP